MEPCESKDNLVEASEPNVTANQCDLTGGERKVIDISKSPLFERYTPHRCVISNSTSDFVCHTIYVISASEYFYVLFNQTRDKFTLDASNNVILPRIKVLFDNNLIESYLQFAYHNKIEITTHEQLCMLLEFGSYLSSNELLSLLEQYMCQRVELLSLSRIKQYVNLAKDYLLANLFQKLSTQITKIATSSDDPLLLLVNSEPNGLLTYDNKTSMDTTSCGSTRSRGKHSTTPTDQSSI